MFNQKSKEVITTNNKKIIIFDNVFCLDERSHFFDFITQSFFVFGGESTRPHYSVRPIAKPHLQSFYSEQDLNKLNFISSPSFACVLPHLSGLEVKRSYVYVSDHTTPHYFHVDPGVKTLLFYPMLEWKNEYGGETMFANEQLSEIEYTSQYVPGRIILFDASIPHKMSAPASTCPFYRFSFLINFG